MTTGEDKKPSKVLSFLYIGSRHHAKDKKTLLELNVKYILNCTPKRIEDPEAGCPNFYEKEKTFVYKRISAFDNTAANLTPFFDTAIDFIDEGKHYGSVLVHCHRGISRSASFVIAYLMKKNEFTLDEALNYLQSIRPIAQPNTTFLAQLQDFAVKISEQEKEEKSSKKRSIDMISKDEAGIGPSVPGPQFPALEKGDSDRQSEI